jgi:hypothetical protein
MAVMFSRPRYERGARGEIPTARRRVSFRDLSPASQQLLLGLLHLQQILAGLTLPREADLAKDQTSASGSTEESHRNPQRSEVSEVSHVATIKTKIPETRRTSSSHSEDGHPEGRQMCQSSDLWRNLEAETTCAQTPASENQHRSTANLDSSVQVEIYNSAIVGQATRTAVYKLLDDVQADEQRIHPPSSVATETEIEDERVTCSTSAETVGSTCEDEDEGVKCKSFAATGPKADRPTCKDEDEDVTCSNTGSSASAARLPGTEELSCEEVVTCSNTRSSTSWFLPDLVMGVVALPDLLVDICRQGSPAD